ncbi:MAG: alpha/beta hydrolase domain-containing protein [Acidimicrobiia bacterium]
MATLELVDARLGQGPYGAEPDALPPGATEQEWFLEGNAARYQLTGDEYSIDGRWEATPAGTTPYRTRVLMARPAADTFNGTVVVVWNNVSSGVDGIYAGPGRPRMLADGYAVLGVSAQKVGIDGPLGLIATDADRYGTLHHPGDDHSYDIFTQATALASTDERLLGGLTTRRVVAAGASQSACRLATLHNALHPAGIVDAYMLIVYAGNGTLVDTSNGSPGFAEVPDNSTVNILPFRSHRLRDDLDVRVFAVNSETEACLFTANAQPDSDHLRIWESAGTSHIGLSQIDLPDMGNGAPCRGSFAPAITAAYEHLQRWLTDGTLPPSQPRIERTADGTAVRDEHGNVLGGIRWPHVEVPLGTHRGEARPGAIDLMGATTPFDAETVHSLYPSRDDYEGRFAAAVTALVATGSVLPEDSATVRDPLAETAWS